MSADFVLGGMFGIGVMIVVPSLYGWVFKKNKRCESHHKGSYEQLVLGGRQLHTKIVQCEGRLNHLGLHYADNFGVAWTWSNEESLEGNTNVRTKEVSQEAG